MLRSVSNPFTATIPYQDIAKIYDIARDLLQAYPTNKIWILEGELGAGKTTLSKAMCQILGVDEAVQSPTFNLIHSYHTKFGDEVHHIDLYRVKSRQEALELGLDEYLHSGQHCFVEWGNLFSELLDVPHIHIRIHINQEDLSRTITAKNHENRKQ